MSPTKALSVVVVFAFAALLGGGPAHGQDDPPREPRRWACSIVPGVGAESGVYGGDLWPNGLIPYAFDQNVDGGVRLLVRAAMDELEDACGARFVPRAGHADYVLIYLGFGNSSAVGRQGGLQELELADWDERYIIAHELMHAMGVWHEQQRPDRDNFIIVHEGRLPGGHHNYAIQGTAFGDYNFDSIMHYGQCDFSPCFDCETNPAPCRIIECLPQYAQFQNTLGNIAFLSDGDQELLAFLYPQNCGLQSGLAVRVYNLPAGGALSVHACAGAACQLLGGRQAGSTGTIQGSATLIDGVRWWEITWTDGLTGWSAERSGNVCQLEEAPPPPDSAPPTVAIASPLDGAQVAASGVVVSGTAGDPGTPTQPASGVERVDVRLNLGAWQPAAGTTNWSKPLTLLGGPNTIDARSLDRAGLFSTIRTARVTFVPPDTTPPLVTILTPTIEATFLTSAASLNVAGTANDTVGVAHVGWANNRGGAGDAQGTSSWSVSGIVLESGVNQITIIARDAAGNQASDELRVIFTPPDLTAPTISITQPTSGSMFQTSLPAIDLRGTATDDGTVVEVTWINRAGGRGIANGRDSWAALNIPLAPGENVITLTAGDAAGNRASAVITVSYVPPDTRAPLAPAGLTATVLGVDQIALDWPAAEDVGNSGVKEYSVFRDGAAIGTTAERIWTDSALAAGTNYCYTVAAVDHAGNISPKSAERCATTASAVNGQPSVSDVPALDPNISDQPLRENSSGGCGGAALAMLAVSSVGTILCGRRQRDRGGRR